MTSIPLTQNPAGAAREEAIRNAVRSTAAFPAGGVPALPQHTDAFHRLIADPRVHRAIYTLPDDPTREDSARFIARHIEERERGEGLLLITFDETGEASGYHDIQVWPQWAACELGGAIRPDLQSRGAGGAGALEAFDWLFETIGVDLICETAARDNVRTHKLLERIGFAFKGEVESRTSAGGVRPSMVWELSRDEWTARNAAAGSL